MSKYFAPLVLLPTIIAKPGVYITRSGERVKLYTVSTHHDFGCVGMYIESQISECWHKTGRILATSETKNDIIAIEKENAA